jgi:hypothetical protein
MIDEYMSTSMLSGIRSRICLNMHLKDFNGNLHLINTSCLLVGRAEILKWYDFLLNSVIIYLKYS